MRKREWEKGNGTWGTGRGKGERKRERDEGTRKGKTELIEIPDIHLF
ncbi:MAG: hypothetical protein NTX22_15465 [Ignavibacteriales bacterium]|nr:hypothetical protein [Ignavibacteriales bacterium]